MKQVEPEFFQVGCVLPSGTTISVSGLAAELILIRGIGTVVKEREAWWIEAITEDTEDFTQFTNPWHYAIWTKSRPNNSALSQLYVLHRVIDGDSIEGIKIRDGDRVTFRLAGIDAVELNQRLGRAAKARLEDIFWNTHYFLANIYAKDPHKRLLADIWSQPNLYVNSQLIKEGLALTTRSHPVHKQRYHLRDCQAIAQEAKLNYWSIKEQERMHPKTFRKNNPYRK